MSTNDEACALCNVNHHAPGAPKCKAQPRCETCNGTGRIHSPSDPYGIAPCPACRGQKR